MKKNKERQGSLASLLSNVSNRINFLLMDLQTLYSDFGIECLVQNDKIRNQVMSILSPINFINQNQLPDVICLHEEKQIVTQVKVYEDEQQEEEDTVKADSGNTLIQDHQADDSSSSSSDSEPELQKQFYDYLRRRVLKVSRSGMRRSNRSKQVSFLKQNKDSSGRRPLSTYAHFTSMVFKHIRNMRIKIGHRPSSLVGEMWSLAQRRGLALDDFDQFIKDYSKNLIKSLHQGQEDKLM